MRCLFAYYTITRPNAGAFSDWSLPIFQFLARRDGLPLSTRPCRGLSWLRACRAAYLHNADFMRDPPRARGRAGLGMRCRCGTPRLSGRTRSRCVACRHVLSFPCFRFSSCFAQARCPGTKAPHCRFRPSQSLLSVCRGRPIACAPSRRRPARLAR